MKRAEQIDFEQAVYDAFGQVKDFTLAVRIARYFYEKAEKDTREELLEWAKEKADFYKQTANIRRSFEMVIDKLKEI